MKRGGNTRVKCNFGSSFGSWWRGGRDIRHTFLELAMEEEDETEEVKGKVRTLN
jgi:hypothetical protein